MYIVFFIIIILNIYQDVNARHIFEKLYCIKVIYRF